MAGRYDIKAVQGDTLEVIFDYDDPAGVAIDLTGYYAIMQMRVNPSDPSPQVSLDSRVTGGGILFIDPTTYQPDPTKGCVFVQVTRAQAEAMAPPGGWYQLKIIAIDESVEFTLAYGQYKIFPEVAK